MDEWDEIDMRYSQEMLGKLRILLNRLIELPKQYVDSVREMQNQFLHNFTSTSHIILNLCAKVMSTGMSFPSSTFQVHQFTTFTDSHQSISIPTTSSSTQSSMTSTQSSMTSTQTTMIDQSRNERNEIKEIKQKEKEKLSETYSSDPL